MLSKRGGCTGRSLRLKAERLEDKRLLAGDVHVVVSHGDLEITGDDNDNHVEIRATANEGEYLILGVTVEGTASTLINGQPSITVDGVDDDFEIDMRDGNNSLLFWAGQSGDPLVVPDDLDIRNGHGQISVDASNLWVGDDLWLHTHDGNDAVVLRGIQVHGEATFELGAGKNTVTIEAGEFLDESTIGDDLKIEADDGPDAVVLEDLFIGDDAELDLDGGDNSVVLDNTVTWEDLRIDTEDGADTVNLRNGTRAINDAVLELGDGLNALILDEVFVEDDLHITGGHDQGGDDIRIEDTIVLDEIEVSARAGDDVLTMINVKPRRMHIHMDRGMDRLEMRSVNVSHETLIRGDDGMDTLAQDDENVLSRLSVRTFERFEELGDDPS